jgi:hypothetical protein
MFINNIVSASFVEWAHGYNGWHASFNLAKFSPQSSSFTFIFPITFVGGPSSALLSKLQGKLLKIVTSSSTIEKTS